MLIKRQAGMKNVVELRAGEELQIGASTVRAVPAEHDTGRLPFGARADPLGYVIEGAGRSVYFAGDTDVFPGMAELAPVDLALLPIWGWGPTMGPGHMDPERAAHAAALLRTPLAIPIHWGTYYPVHLGLRGAPTFLKTPPALFEQAVREQAPATEVRVLQPGASTEI
jgi:L-ascorbate metabolism protein UlaG (beta-lactamase superfamily)